MGYYLNREVLHLLEFSITGSIFCGFNFNVFRLSFSKPKCARGGHILFLESMFQHSPEEIVNYSINSYEPTRHYSGATELNTPG